ncbi:MAG: hypothetical protein ACOZB3_06605 [Calditrichota bacterium]
MWSAVRHILEFGIAAAVITTGGCDLFSTRDAETPGGGRSTWETPREPQDVLTNLTAAIFERNTVNYLRSFDADGFLFQPDPFALSQHPNLEGWAYDDESAHATRLFSEGTLPQDSIIFVVFSATETNFMGDSVEVHTQYDFSAGVTLAGAPRRMAGTADFYLHMGREGYWAIYRWRDSRTEDQSTWSDLKSVVQ